MTDCPILPDVPTVQLKVIEDLTPSQPRGFLKLVRRRLVAIGPGETRSEPFTYDEVDRKGIDAVVVAAYFFDHGQEPKQPRVYLRSATRPPVALRDMARPPIEGVVARLGLWELVAGIVELEESHPAGIVDCARRELGEELGFRVEREALRPLGTSTFPAPGVIGERHFFFEVEVDPARRGQPSLDGSPLERLGAIVDVTLVDALRACANGEIEDAKTELGLRRLAERLGCAR
ncbi:MAG TPA: NUDIX domain-containing protein [Polyangiaceae bacterium]